MQARPAQLDCELSEEMADSNYTIGVKPHANNDYFHVLNELSALTDFFASFKPVIMARQTDRLLRFGADWQKAQKPLKTVSVSVGSFELRSGLTRNDGVDEE